MAKQLFKGFIFKTNKHVGTKVKNDFKMSQNANSDSDKLFIWIINFYSRHKEFNSFLYKVEITRHKKSTCNFQKCFKKNI